MDNIVLERTWVRGAPVIIDDLRGTAFTGEAGAHTFRIAGQDADHTPATIAGVVTGKFLAPNGVTVPLTGSSSGGVASVTLTSDCYAVPGRFVLSVYLTADGVTVCIYCGVGSVYRTDSGQAAYPSAALPDISELITDLQTAIGSIPADYSEVLAAIAPDFDPTAAYDVGRYVWYDGTLYRFTAAHAAGAWSSSEATAGTLADIVTINSATAAETAAYLGIA